MLNFNSILIFSEDPKALSGFYEKVFGKKPDWEDYGYFVFSFGSTNLTVGPHDKVKGKSKQPERIMINFETSDVAGEFARIKEIEGVKIIAEPYEMGGEGMLIATLEDIDGNYFQLMSPFVADVDLTKN